MTVPPQARPDGFPLTDTHLAEIEARVNAVPMGSPSSPMVEVASVLLAEVRRGRERETELRAENDKLREAALAHYGIGASALQRALAGSGSEGNTG